MNWKWLRGKRRNEELSEEIDAHLWLAEREEREIGKSDEDARHAARREFGNVAMAEETTRDHWGMRWLDDFRQDLRGGLRMLRRSPGFTALAVLCLTLGIGANAAVFSSMEGVLFRPYPMVAHQERLMALSGTARGETGPTGVSWPDFEDLRKSSSLIDGMFVSKIMGTTLSLGNRAETLPGSIVSANYFDEIGVRPMLGRGFAPGEDVGSNAHPVVVISYELWQRMFKGDPEIVGKTQRLNGVMHTIVGVAPEGFRGTFVGWAMQFWVPASMEETFEAGGYKLQDRDARWVESFVRLKPGVTRQQAQQEASAIATRLAATFPETNRGRGLQLWALWQTPFNHAGTLLPTLELMLAVALFVLLIACANVGNLLLVRSFARRHEMSVRAALGAGRTRLLRQMLTEGLILAALASCGALLVAYWSEHALVLFFPASAGVAMYLPGALDWRVLWACAAVSVLTTVLLGLFPAVQASKIDVAAALKTEMAGVVGGGRGKNWARAGLVIVQVSLSFLLLVGTGLVVKSLQRIRGIDPGFSTKNVLVTPLALTGAGYDPTRAKSFDDELLRRVRSLPGVESAALARLAPLGVKSYSSSAISVDGYVPPPDEQETVEYNEVGPGYFGTMGIPLAGGREFALADDEDAALVAVVNETLAAKYWKGGDPIGQRMQVKGRWMTVVGVAKDSKYESMRELPRAFFYVPLRQNFAVAPTLVVRSGASPETLSTEVARETKALDPDLASYELVSIEEVVKRATASQQAAVTMLAVLGGLALLLAAIGLYAVMAYAVSQSGRELGLRMALGAGQYDLLRLVMMRGVTLTSIGVLVGGAAAIGLTRLMGDLLFRVSPRDPAAFGLAFVAMMITAVAACFLPAWRATQADPMRTLRE
jgi:macrolide transport system ATP-binding/permease protein